jgi:hypothetical protein
VNGGVTAIIEHFTVQNGFSGDGGGVSSDGSLTLNSSIVSGNTGEDSGGGISNGGTMIVNNSAVIDNVGGGISSGGILALNSSTVSGNTASYIDGGGGITNDGTLTLNNCTVSGNSGGINNRSNDSTVTLQNTILADNTASGISPDCNGDIDSLGYNLVGDTSGCTFPPTTGDLLDVHARLFPLIGSPGYHPLLFSSPAIDAGNPAGCTDHLGNRLDTDQRGVARVGRCDIGAYEFDPANDPLTYVFLPVVTRND